MAIYQIAANTAFVEWVPDTHRAQAFGLTNMGTVLRQGAALKLAGAAEVMSPSTAIALGGVLDALVACALALR